MEESAAELYLDLLKRALTRSIDGPHEGREPQPVGWRATLYEPVRRLLARGEYRIVTTHLVDEAGRTEGAYWPATADTMIGMKRLDNLHACIRSTVIEGIPGDFIETGVWRGGACIFARGALKAYGDTTRRVWVADSFRGLPKPDPAYPDDARDGHWRQRPLAVSVDEVRSRFARYGLLDERVEFVVGWFSETLASVPADAFSIIRLDGDMYGSTIQALEALYDRVSHGGFVVIDDYALPGCRKAVDDFRGQRGITDPISPIDWTGVFWRKGVAP